MESNYEIIYDRDFILELGEGWYLNDIREVEAERIEGILIASNVLMIPRWIDPDSTFQFIAGIYTFR